MKKGQALPSLWKSFVTLQLCINDTDSLYIYIYIYHKWEIGIVNMGSSLENDNCHLQEIKPNVILKG